MVYTEKSLSREKLETDILSEKVVVLGCYNGILNTGLLYYIYSNKNLYILKNLYIIKEIIYKYNNFLIYDFNLNNKNKEIIIRNNIKILKNKEIINNIKDRNNNIIEYIYRNLNLNYIDIRGLYYISTGNSLDKNELLKINSFQEIFQKLQTFNLIHSKNNIIPTVGLLSEFGLLISQYYKSLFHQFHSNISTVDYKAYLLRVNLFQELKNNGICVNGNFINQILLDEKSKNILKDKNKKLYNTILNFSDNDKNIIYPEYYLDRTPTGRVMSSYKFTNMMALNKSDITRKLIKSRFHKGRLFDFDFDGMQLRIISNLIGFDIPSECKAHKFMASYKLNIDYKAVTEEQIKEAKEAIWKVVYGEENIPNFSDKLHKFIKNNILESKTPLGRKIKKSLGNHYRLNYFINEYEVDYITLVLLQISNYIKEENLKMVVSMYTYDGLVIDCPPEEFNNIKDIKNIAENVLASNIYPVRIKIGKNFKDMEKYNG